MTRHLGLICSLILALACGGKEIDPLVGEKKVSEWRTELLAARDQERSDVVSGFINKRPLPGALLSVLLELLPTGPKEFPTTRQALATTLARVCEDAPDVAEQLFSTLDSGTDDQRIIVLQAIGRMNEKAASAAPRVLKIAADPSQATKVRRSAIAALGKIHPPADSTLLVLRELLKEFEKELRIEALRSIGTFGAAAKDLLPDLLDILRNPKDNSDVRGEAALALGRLDSTGKDVVPALIEVLTGVDVSSAYVSQALSMIGPEAATAVPALTRALSSNSSYQISCAASALGRIGAASRPAVSELLRILKNTNGRDDRHALATALGDLEAQAPEALPVLLELMQTDRWSGTNPSPIEYAVVAVAVASWWVGTTDRGAVENIKDLRELLNAKGQYLSKYAEAARVPGQRVSPCLARAIPRFAVRMGVKDELIIQILNAAEKNPDAEVKANAAVARLEWTSKKLQPLPAPKPLPPLDSKPEKAREALYDGHSLSEWAAALRNIKTQSDAADALCHMGADGARAVLKAHAPNESPRLRFGLLSAEEISAIAPAVLEALTDPDVWVRRVAPGWVKHLPDAAKKEALPDLIKALTDAELPVKLKAAEALGLLRSENPEMLGPLSSRPEIIQMLETASKDTDATVARVAKETMIAVKGK